MSKILQISPFSNSVIVNAINQILTKARWLPAWQLRHLLTLAEKNSLLEKASLTKLVQNFLGRELSADVLRQSWEMPLVFESQALNLSLRRYCFVRTVNLKHGADTIISARVVFPEVTLQGQKGRWLRAHLDERPLGLLLFSDPNWHRSNFLISRIQPCENTKKIMSFPGHQDHLWARCSLFWYGGRPLHISEIFSPIMFETTS